MGGNSVDNAKLAIIEWTCHVIAVCALLFGFWVVESIFYYLWDDKVLFDVLPLKYVFDAFDLAILILFSLFGVYSFIKTYAGWGSEVDE